MGLFVNCVGIPIPSEIIIPLTGIGMKQGHFDFVTAVVVMTLAQLGGLAAEYAIGRFGGVELVQRYGRYIFISRRELKRAEVAFQQYGGRLVLFGLVLPGIHGYVGYPAGIAKMPFIRFLVTALVGVLAWTLAFLAIGYFVGDHLEQIDAAMHKFAIVIIIALIMAAIWYIRRRKRNIHLEDSPVHSS